MKTSGALLVLLCCCLAETLVRGETISENDITHQGHSGEAETSENEVMGAEGRTEAAATASTQQTCQPDINTVLKEISALMAEQRVELRYTKTQMEAMETRLRASENKAETMETRLRASENKVEEQREKQEEQAAAVRAVGGSVNLTGIQVEELRRESKERRVSFSASLESSSQENFGPYSRSTTLIYRHVITNTGNAYSPHTGVFTAPVRGVYFFTVFVYGAGHKSKSTRVSLHKNDEHVVIAHSHSHQPTDSLSTSNGASLLLEEGDVVYVKLWPDAWVRETINHHTTFSGHLLFLM